MPMTTASNQVELGDYLYFFTSPVPDTASCLIFGHAGWVPRLGEEFELPAGVSLHFKSWHGDPNNTNPTRTILAGAPQHTQKDIVLAAAPTKAARMLTDARDKRDFRGGERCYDYVIVKGLGRHWEAANPAAASYTQIKQKMDVAQGTNYCDHFVSIRNRRFHGAQRYVMLSAVIDQVRAHDATITRFIMAGCRGVEPHWTP
jgi:hypothetical protein